MSIASSRRSWVALIAVAACHVDPILSSTDLTSADATTDTDLTSTDTDSVDTDLGDTDTPADTDTSPVESCREVPATANRDRAVIVSFPYKANGDPANRWEVLVLRKSGQLDRPGGAFTMGRAPWGRVEFSPDGSLGVVAQDDGTLGIFTLDAQGHPTVVETAWNGDAHGTFYANNVLFDATGGRLWVVDEDWPASGGGIYEVTLDCATGAPTLVGQVLPTKLAKDLRMLPGGRLLVVGSEVDTHAEGDAYTIDGWPAAPSVNAGARLFDYDDAAIASDAVTPDGRYALVGDNSEFIDVANNVAWARVDGSAPIAGGHIDLRDPFDLIMSPFGDAVLVASGYGNALFALTYDPLASTPFTSQGELTYTGTEPALPSTMAVIVRGPLKGLVLVSENTDIREVRFASGATVTDLGAVPMGGGLSDIPGAIGVQP